MSSRPSNESALPTSVPDAPDVLYTTGGSLLVVADSAAGSARLNAAAVAAGLPVFASVGIDDALGQLARRPRWVILEVEESPKTPAATAVLESLLDCIAADTAAGRYTAVLSTPMELVDLVARRASNPRVGQLANATQPDRVSALIEADRLGRSQVRERASEGAEAMRLRPLTDEVERMVGALAQLTAGATAVAPAQPALPDAPADADSLDAAELRRIVRARRLRARHFDAALFADPAWDMLLDLTAARIEDKPVAVSSLCIAAAVPATTALRWIRMLTDAGLFVRHADPTDGRRVFVGLSDDAATGMRNYLAELRREAA